MMNGSFSMNALGWVGMVLMAVVTVALVGLVVRAATSDRQARARAVLAGRLARGELDAQEYRERLEARSAHRA